MDAPPDVWDLLVAVSFVNANTGWVLGANGTILRSTDGGASWTRQASGTTNHLYAASFVNTTTGWVLGANGTILNTTTGGD